MKKNRFFRKTFLQVAVAIVETYEIALNNIVNLVALKPSLARISTSIAIELTL